MTEQYGDMPALRNGYEREESINLQWEPEPCPSEVKRLMDRSIDGVDSTLLTFTEKAVLREILWLDRDVDMGCTLSAETIAMRKGTTARTVRRCRQSLMEKGLLRRRRGKPTPSWFVCWPWYDLPQAPTTSNGTAIAMRWAALLNQYLAHARGLPGRTNGPPPLTRCPPG